LLGVIALGASASLLAACSGSAQPAASTAPAATSGPVSSAPAKPAATLSGARSTEASPAQPKAGGTLRALSTQDLAPIDGHYHHPGNGLSSWTVYEPLITYDDDLKPQPLLAETWDQSSDAKQIAITLRLEDVYRRRTGLMLFSHDNGRSWLETLASDMAELLGWSADRRREEISRTMLAIDRMFTFRADSESAGRYAELTKGSTR
jgi:hypothetical protein